MTTRSQAAKLAIINSRNPQSIEAFKEGVGSVLRQWTALELAVFHQWGGANSKERADELVTELIQLFLSPEKVYKDDISLILEDYLESQFSTICEDGSPDELGELLCEMWRQCLDGDFTLVHNALAREYVRHEVISQSQGLDNGDIDDDESDEEETADKQEGIILDTIQEIEEEQEKMPLVDEDGFQTVVRGKKSKGKSYKI